MADSHRQTNDVSASPGWDRGAAASCPDGARPAIPPHIRAAVSGERANSDEEQREPCPAPLAWQQVLEAFRSESHGWEFEHRGSRLRGRTWGEGPPLYLLPGIGGTQELLALLVWLLRDEFRCVVFDYPEVAERTAHGGRERLSAAELADDLLAVADRHGDDRFRLFATSFGSVAAFTAMLDASQRVEAAVIHAGFARRRLSWAERLLIRVGRRTHRHLADVPLRAPLQQQSHRPWFPPFDHGRWRFFIENTGAVKVRDLAERAAVMRDFDVRDRLAEISQPVLLLRCEGDGAVADRCSRELQAGLPNVRQEWLHSCGQLPYLTHPHRTAKVMRTFFLGDERSSERESESTVTVQQ